LRRGPGAGLKKIGNPEKKETGGGQNEHMLGGGTGGFFGHQEKKGPSARVWGKTLKGGGTGDRNHFVSSRGKKTQKK